MGDYVRVTLNFSPKWIEGEIVSLRDHNGHIVMRPEHSNGNCFRCYIESGSFSFKATDKVSNIQRPGQYERESPRPLLTVDEDGSMTARPASQRIGTEPITAPTLYDGLTAQQCLRWFTTLQREGENDARTIRITRPFIPLTPAQLSAARNLWSQQLKQRISAAKERERLQVRIDVQDYDD